MSSHSLSLLLVEDSLSDQQLLREAFAEIAEEGHRYDWFSCEPILVDYLSDALHCLARAEFAAILLNPDLPDAPRPLETLADITSVAPRTPVIVMMDRYDRSQATRLLREGADDVLIKRELDCNALVRTIRHAVERGRRTRAAQSVSFFDALTSLFNVNGLEFAAAQNLAAASAAGAAVHAAVFEVHGLGPDSHSAALTLIETADLLRAVMPETAVLARTTASRFVALAFEPLEAAARTFTSELKSSAPALTSSIEHQRIADLDALRIALSGSVMAAQAG